MGPIPWAGRDYPRSVGEAHKDTLAALRELAAETGWTVADATDVALAAGVEVVRARLAKNVAPIRTPLNFQA